MQIESTRFGMLEVREDTVITFPDGLIGLPGTQYALLAQSEKTPFYWLHSCEYADLAVPVTMPWLFFSGYEVEIPDDEADRLGISESKPGRDLLRRHGDVGAQELHDQPRRPGDREQRDAGSGARSSTALPVTLFGSLCSQRWS